MKKNSYTAPLVIIVPIIVLVMGASVILFPEWQDSPQNFFILFGAAVITVVPLVHYYFSIQKNMKQDEDRTRQAVKVTQKGKGTHIDGDMYINGDFVGRDRVEINNINTSTGYPAEMNGLSRRTQEMKNSEQGQQYMKGEGGVMEQRMKNSPGGKQSME